MSEIQKKALRAGRRVGIRHVNEVIRNYKQERWLQNSRRLGKEDSLSVWYSLEELEKFMLTCKSHGGDGVRLYFGAYSNEHAPKPQYAGRQTIVLVATKDKETGNGVISKDLYVNSEKGIELLAYNLGRLCPPYCNISITDQAGIAIVDKGSEGIVVV